MLAYGQDQHHLHQFVPVFIQFMISYLLLKRLSLVDIIITLFDKLKTIQETIINTKHIAYKSFSSFHSFSLHYL